MNNKLLGAGDLIENSWLIYRNNWKKLAKPAFWMFLPTLLVTAVSLLLRILQINDILALIISLLVSIPAYLVQIWATMIFVLLLDAALSKREFDVRNLSLDAVRKFLPALWVVVLTGLAILGGFIAFVIPGVIFAVWFAFAYYEAVLNNAKGVEALKKSRALVTGRFFATLWRLGAGTLFWSVIIWLAISTLFLLFGALSQPWKELVSGEPGATYISAILDVVANAVQSLSAPLFTAVGVILFRALKETKTESAS